MRVLTGAIVALALVGSAGAHAQQIYLAEPAPVYGNPGPSYAAAPVVVAPGYVAPDYAYVPTPFTGSTVVVNSRTGRSCTLNRAGIGGAGRHSSERRWLTTTSAATR
jgi:hypothetical protein